MLKKLAPIALVAFSLTAISTAAQAQVALDNGVSINTRPVTGPYTTIDLGSQAGTGFISSMPLSLSYANVNVNLSFGNGSGLVASGSSNNPSPGQNFIHSAAANGATFQFSSVQSFFAASWSTPDDANMLSFYNGSQLLTSVSGSQFRSLAGVGLYSPASNAAFNFSELGYDRVVASGVIGGSMQIGAISFSDQPVDIAPIPLNAASLGGLMSFLMMLAMRGKGGTQVMLRMAFASIMPRRRGMA